MDTTRVTRPILKAVDWFLFGHGWELAGPLALGVMGLIVLNPLPGMFELPYSGETLVEQTMFHLLILMGPVFIYQHTLAVYDKNILRGPPGSDTADAIDSSDDGVIEPYTRLVAISPEAKEVFRRLYERYPIGAAHEEMVFRGWFMAVPAYYFGTTMWAFLIPATLLFTVIHLQYNRWGLIGVGYMGLGLGVLFIMTQSLLYVSLLHYLANAVTVLLSLRVATN